MASSFLRSIHRAKRTPHTCSAVAEKRSWENGIRISTVQPSESMAVAACQTGAQESSENSPSPPRGASFFRLFLDSYHDHRTAFEFIVKPPGGKKDVPLGGDGQFSDDPRDPGWQAPTAV